MSSLVELFAAVGEDDPVAVLPALIEAFEASTLGFFAVSEQLREDEIVEKVDAVVQKGLSGKRLADGLLVTYDGHEHFVRLPATGAGVVTVRALAEMVPDVIFTWLVATYASPVLGFCAVPRDDWLTLETRYPQATRAHFVDPRTIPVLTGFQIGGLDAPAKELLIDLGFRRDDFYYEDDEEPQKTCFQKVFW